MHLQEPSVSPQHRLNSQVLLSPSSCGSSLRMTLWKGFRGRDSSLVHILKSKLHCPPSACSAPVAPAPTFLCPYTAITFTELCPSRAICFLPLSGTILTHWLNTLWSSQSHTFQHWQFNFQSPSFSHSKNARLCIVMAKIKLFPFISHSWTAVWRLVFFFFFLSRPKRLFPTIRGCSLQVHLTSTDLPEVAIKRITISLVLVFKYMFLFYIKKCSKLLPNVATSPMSDTQALLKQNTIISRIAHTYRHNDQQWFRLRTRTTKNKL